MQFARLNRRDFITLLGSAAALIKIQNIDFHARYMHAPGHCSPSAGVHLGRSQA
jgi:hypothetical protein